MGIARSAVEHVDQVQKADMAEIGDTGLIHSGGEIFEELLRQLTGRQATRIYKEMSNNDPVVGAMLFAIDMLVRQVDWLVDPFSDDQSDLDNAQFLEEVRDDMIEPWSAFVSEVMTMLPFGWSWFEKVYKIRRGPVFGDPVATSRYSDNRVGVAKLAIRSQDSLDRWVFGDHGEIEALVQKPAPSYIDRIIPREKSLLFRTAIRKGNPEGVSVLRNAYRPWYFKKRIEEIEAIGVSRDLAGLPVAHVPPRLLSKTASDQDKALLAKIKQIVRNVRRDDQEGMTFPLAYDDKGNLRYKFELMSTGGRRQFDTSVIVERYDRRIAMVALADVILMGHEKVGSFALASSKTNLFGTALGSFLDVIEDELNRQLVPQLFRLNGQSDDRLPMFRHGDIETIELEEVGEYISKLSGAGMSMFPTQEGELERHLLEQANLPVPAELMTPRAEREIEPAGSGQRMSDAEVQE